MSTGDRVKGWVRDNIGYAAIGLLALAYVGTAIMTMKVADKGPLAIVADGFTYLLLCVAVDRMFTMQGLMNGERDPIVQATRVQHGKAVESVAPYMNYLDVWCVAKTREALKTARERLLMRGGMSYANCFDAEGKATGFRPHEMPRELYPHDRDTPWEARQRKRRRRDFEREEKMRRSCYDAAVRMNVTPLVSGALTGISFHKDDPFNFGVSRSEYEARESGKSTLWHILTAALFGYYSVGLIEAFSYEVLVLRIFQVALAIGFGIFKMHSSYVFVTERQRGETVHKIDVLQMFYAHMQAKKPITEKTKEVQGNE